MSQPLRPAARSRAQRRAVLLPALAAAALALGPGASFAAIARRTFQVRYTGGEAAQRAVEKLDGSKWEDQDIQVRKGSFEDEVFVTGSGPLGPWERFGQQFKELEGFKGWRQFASNTIGEVRYSSSDEAIKAVQTLDGTSYLGKHPIVVEHASPTSTKVYVHGLPSSDMKFTELKELMRKAGKTEFVEIHYYDAEVRFSTAEGAEKALVMDGSEFMGYTIQVKPHPNTKDSTKVLVKGLGVGVPMKQLKDHFAKAGNVKFVGRGRPHNPRS